MLPFWCQLFEILYYPMLIKIMRSLFYFLETATAKVVSGLYNTINNILKVHYLYIIYILYK